MSPIDCLPIQCLYTTICKAKAGDNESVIKQIVHSCQLLTLQLSSLLVPGIPIHTHWQGTGGSLYFGAAEQGESILVHLLGGSLGSPDLSP